MSEALPVTALVCGISEEPRWAEQDEASLGASSQSGYLTMQPFFSSQNFSFSWVPT